MNEPINLTPDDPRLTAYALNELDAADRAAVESALEQSPECRAAVDEIRQMAGMIADEFSREPAPVLSDSQRDAVAAGTPAGIVDEGKLIELPVRRWSDWKIAALAACLVVSLGGVLWISAPRGKSRQSMAKMDTTLPKPVAPVAEPAGEKPQFTKVSGDVGSGQAEQHRVNEPTPVPAPVVPSPPAGNETPRISEKVEIAKSRVDDPQVDSAKMLTLTPKPMLEIPTPAPISPKVQSGDGSYDKMSESPVQFAIAPQNGSPTSPAVGRRSPEEIAKDPYGRSFKPAPASGPASGASVTTSLSSSSAVQRPGGGGGGGFGGGYGGGSIPNSTQSRQNQSPLTRLMQARAGEARLPEQGSVQLQSAQSLNYAWRETVPGEAEAQLLRYRRVPDPHTTASYPHYPENPFLPVFEQPLSTFSIDVDTASYANVRRFLRQNRLPSRDAVRIEELINYFSYHYPQPKADEPFSANIEVAASPWNPQNRLVRIGLKGREIAQDKRPPSNFVFLIDVSGSMSPVDRLPLIKQSLRLLVKRMNAADRVGIVVYAGAAGTALESTSCEQKEMIIEAIERLEAGGSTNGGDGIQRAYALAGEHFIKGGVNRVILCTDGDFNVGITDQAQLVQLIQEKAKGGVFLSALGVGNDNYKDALMQKMADKGNGNYHYIDSLEEAQKVLIEQMNGTLVTIAKDVKIQVEFNPAVVGSYRLIGYEKRVLANADFNDDTKDAGEIGAGHTVTALYEAVPAGVELRPVADGLKYQPAPRAPKPPVNNDSKEMLTLKLRYKKPDGDTSRLSEFVVVDQGYTFNRATADFRFAAAVAEFGMLLKDSPNKGTASFESVLGTAEGAKGNDAEGYRAEFITLVKKARDLARAGRAGGFEPVK